MKTRFTRKPSSLRDVMENNDSLHRNNNDKDMSEYYIAAEKHLTAHEWIDLTEHLLTDRDWIRDFCARRYPLKNKAVACLRVTGDGSDIMLIIDPSGYGYARYVGFEDASKSTPQPTDTEPSRTSSASQKHTVVVKVWRGLVSEVYASDPNTEIIIVDEDTDGETPEQMPEHRVY